ncbi:MAG TPA: sigma 54-interacting transcriptional regulator [Firmicutes bacterium]|nr:sigma 54-interacting transcriptional regulator [Bacillota bacterium]
MRQGSVRTIPERCKACGSCVSACPSGAVALVGQRAVVDDSRCEACGRCITACPNKAKRMVFPNPEPEDIRKALLLMGRVEAKDQLDCGACGFATCWEKAISVLRGLSSPDACLPYAISERQNMLRVKTCREGERAAGGVGTSLDASIVAYSVEMGRVLQLASKVANVNSTVLLLGESGVGKEVVARYIHRTGYRKAGPFIKINCGAIPETLLESELFGYETGAFTGAKREGKPGMIELASGGTLFLDEISELPLNLQVKLLQVIQERQLVRIGGIRPIEVDIRIIAATNRDLQAMVREGTFRADLFYRLNVVPIRVPPLRERRDDIVPLIYHFLERFNQKYHRDMSISEEAKDRMLAYEWPGNVRELENLMERLVVTVDAPAILPCHLPEEVRGEGRATPCKGAVYVRGIVPLKEATEEVERQIITRALERNESTYRIAKLLGVNQSTVVRKIRKYARP